MSDETALALTQAENTYNKAEQTYTQTPNDENATNLLQAEEALTNAYTNHHGHPPEPEPTNGGF